MIYGTALVLAIADEKEITVEEARMEITKLAYAKLSKAQRTDFRYTAWREACGKGTTPVKT